MSPHDGRVAVLGMAGRFPGAASLEQFWTLLRDAEEGLCRFSRQELRAAGVPAARLDDPRYVPVGAPLLRVEDFDGGFFAFSPREAELLDPQQRIFMECVWEAFEDAGCPPRPEPGRDRDRGEVGVFAGASISDYLLYHLLPRHGLEPVMANLTGFVGNEKDYLATHVAYKLGLQGPALTVQTACSTSLVAVHLACQSLLDGECDLAVAGGVTVRLPQERGYLFEEGGYASPDGHCRAFDAAAGGTVFGNGAGVVVLKRLADALEDGDRVRAVILGSAVNNDGDQKVTYTAPSVDGQAAVIAEALGVAGVDPATVGHVEAHGTGTPLGDPIETKALIRAFGAAGEEICGLSSAKTNVGHLEAAAGITGLIKAVLALEHGEMPANLHFNTPNPHLGLEGSPFYVVAERRPWPCLGGAPRRGGVSSFGIGGTNAHLVLEEAPPRAPRSAARAGARLIPLSARDAGALRDLARQVGERLAPSVGPAPELADVAHSAALRRAHHAHRLAVVGDDGAAMGASLGRFAAGQESAAEEVATVVSGEALAGRAPRVVFVFPGQGSQWLGMGRELMAAEPAFRAALERCDRAIAAEAGWSLLAELAADEASSRLGEVDVVQPALFAFGVGLAALWREWGIAPAAVVGQSLGEVAAAHVAGALSLEDAVRVICRRSRLVKSLRGQGGMAMVELPAAAARREIADQGSLAVAVAQSPRATVLAGEESALDGLLERLAERGTYCRRVKVDYASHSTAVEPVLGELRAALAGLRPRPPEIPFYSTVAGFEVPSVGKERFDAEYWVANLRREVRFGPVVERMARDAHSDFIELSPHPVLVPAIEDALAALAGNGTESAGLALASVRREALAGERGVMLESLGRLYCRGHAVAWEKLAGDGSPVPLPSYPWQRRRHWLEPVRAAAPGIAAALGDTPAHPLLGPSLEVAARPGERLWQHRLGLSTVPELAAHRLAGRAVLPAAAWAEMALAAAAEIFGPDGGEVARLRLEEMLILPESGTVTLQTSASPHDRGEDGGLRLEMHSRDETGGWRRHAVGELRPRAASPERPAVTPPMDGAQRAREHYEALARAGLDFGPAFRTLRRLELADGEARAVVERPRETSTAARWQVHPALLDGGVQTFGTMLEAGEEPWIPVELRGLRSHGRSAVDWICRARLAPRAPGAEGEDNTNDGTAEGELTAYDAAGKLLLETRLRCRRVALPRPAPAAATIFHQLVWQSQAPSRAAATGTRRWLLVGAGDGLGEALAALLRERGDAVSQASAVGDLVSPPGGEAPHGVVDLRPLSAPGRAAEDVLDLARWLVRAPWRDAPRLTVLTRGATNGEVPAAAAAWGLARVLMHEHPELSLRLVDLALEEAAAPAGLAAEVAVEITGESAEDEVRLAAGERLVARLSPWSPPSGDVFRPAAAWLITGGLGGLGLAVARWLAEGGATHLILVGRGGPTPQTAPELDALRQAAAGALQVEVVAADVTRPADVAAALDAVPRDVTLEGVVHAAGVLDDALASELDGERLAAVVAPKLAGAWNLEHALGAAGRQDEVRHFVLFSSTAGLLGAPGQANYAAANAALDAFAHERRRAGRPALAVGWGPWAEVGRSAAADRDGAESAARGFVPFPPDRALAALATLLGAGAAAPAQVLTADLDLRQWRELHPAVSGRRLFADLEEAPRSPDAGRGALRRELESLPPAARRGRLEEALVKALAAVLRQPPASITPRTPLAQLGIESLMSLEFRNRLERQLELRLSATLLWTHPNLEELAAFLAQELDIETVPGDSSKTASKSASEAADDDELAGLSADQLAALLESELEESGVEEER